jgi:hypothetical protein
MTGSFEIESVTVPDICENAVSVDIKNVNISKSFFI